MKIKVSNVNTPNWKDVNVKSHIPVELEKLSELARNIGGHGIMKLLNCSKTLTLYFGKKWDRTLFCCWNV